MLPCLSCLVKFVGSLLPPSIGFASMAAASHLGEVHRAITSTLRLFVSSGLIQPSRRNDGCSTCGLSPHPLIVRLRHWNGVGISKIVDVDPVGFPGSHSRQCGNHRDTEGDCPDGEGDV